MTTQDQQGDDQNVLSGESERPQMSIDISPELGQRIQMVAEQRGIPIREYVEQVLEQAVLSPDGGTPQQTHRPVSKESIERLLQARERMKQERQGRPFTDSTELIWQMREERSEHLAEL